MHILQKIKNIISIYIVKNLRYVIRHYLIKKNIIKYV